MIDKIKRKISHCVEDMARIVIFHDPSEELINQNEIRILGLRRSGNHAVSNWIMQQAKGEIFYINNVGANENPYREKYEDLMRSGCLKGRGKFKREARGAFAKKEYLIYSYEDHALEKVANSAFESMHDLYFGKSACRYDVLILRDPFNMVASRLKAHQTREQSYLDIKAKKVTLIDLWIAYAKEGLGETNYLKNRKIVVNYNRWFTDVTYREQLAASLGLEFSDFGMREVKHYGKGSSFDGRDFQEKANQMNVLDRWKNYIDDEYYREILNSNNQLWTYSEKIFGLISGTERLKQ